MSDKKTVAVDDFFDDIVGVKAIFWELLRLAKVTVSDCAPPQLTRLEIRRRTATTEHRVIVPLGVPVSISLREAVRLSCSRIAKGLLEVLTKPDAPGQQLLSASEAFRIKSVLSAGPSPFGLSDATFTELCAAIDRVTAKEAT